MITTHFKGQGGNWMFQYAMGRIVAENKGYALKFSDPDGRILALQSLFPNATEIDGKMIIHNPLYIGPDTQNINLTEVFTHDGAVFLHGYWQKYWYYPPYIEKMKRWFSYDETRYTPPDPDDIVVHYRLGDNISQNWRGVTPIRTIVNIVNSEKPYRKCIVVTDSPTQKIIDGLKVIDNIVIQNGTWLEDFTILKSSKRLILSQSSYCIWAAYLGNQQKIYAPLTSSDSAFWWKFKPTEPEDIELIPNDTRYVKIEI